MKYVLLLVAVLAAAALAAGCTTPSTPGPGPIVSYQAPAGTDDIVVHALVPVTGPLAPYGESSTKVLRIAESDINQYYADIGNPARVSVVIHDTAGDPATARRMSEEVHANGTHFLIGFLTSSELVAMKPYTDMNGMVVLSTTSTAPALAIPGDSLYRMQSDDTAQGRVMASWLSHEKVRAMVPAWRGDVYGDNLVNSTRDSFATLGGVTLDGVRYDPATRNFNALAPTLDDLTGKAIRTYGEGSVGVYAVTFTEIADIVNASREKPNLSRVRWFGSDGGSGNKDLTGTGPAAGFAARVNLTCAGWGIPEMGTPSEDPAIRQLVDRLGTEPDGNVLMLYDMLWIATRVEDDAGYAANCSQLSRSLDQICNSYRGTSQDLTLNTAGDRQLASYDFKRVEPGPAGAEWRRVAQMIVWPGAEEVEVKYV